MEGVWTEDWGLLEREREVVSIPLLASRAFLVVKFQFHQGTYVYIAPKKGKEKEKKNQSNTSRA